MTIPPKYQLTKNIVLLLGKLDTNRAIIDSLTLPPAVEGNIRQASLLGSSLFSARIEGNRLTESDISSFRDLSSKEKQKIEIASLMRAISYLFKKYVGNKPIKIEDILHWHVLAMKNILSEEYLGRFRKSHEGIFDQAGNLIYHAPPPLEVLKLMDNLASYVNSSIEPIVPIRAILGHFILERIHPFEDGNGRVGRLLQTAILVKGGYAMKGLVVVEAEIDKNRPLYYHAIEHFDGDATEFIELILDFLATASQKAKDRVIAGQKYTQEDLLAPRRREILEIIRNHQTVSLDFLSRRFLQIDPRLLRYDLKYLVDEGFIIKIGKTRGALYAPKSS